MFVFLNYIGILQLFVLKTTCLIIFFVTIIQFICCCVVQLLVGGKHDDQDYYYDFVFLVVFLPHPPLNAFDFWNEVRWKPRRRSDSRSALLLVLLFFRVECCLLALRERKWRCVSFVCALLFGAVRPV